MPTATEPTTEVATSSSLPHLDLRPPREVQQIVEVKIKPSALMAGLHTKTCPQCGLNPAGPLVKRSFQYVPPWVYVGLLLNIVVLLILYYAGRTVVKGELTLCPDCDAADTRGRRFRSLSVVGLVGFPIVFATLGGLVAGSDAALAGGFAGLVAAFAGMFAAHRRTRYDVIGCKFADKKKDTMTLQASPAFQRVLAEEASEAVPST